MRIFDSLLACYQGEAGAVVYAAGVARGHRSVRLECGTQLGKLFGIGVSVGIFVGVENLFFLADLYRNGNDFVLERAAVNRLDCLGLRGISEFVLSLTGNPVFFGYVFRP